MNREFSPVAGCYGMPVLSPKYLLRCACLGIWRCFGSGRYRDLLDIVKQLCGADWQPMLRFDEQFADLFQQVCCCRCVIASQHTLVNPIGQHYDTIPPRVQLLQ